VAQGAAPGSAPPSVPLANAPAAKVPSPASAAPPALTTSLSVAGTSPATSNASAPPSAPATPGNLPLDNGLSGAAKAFEIPFEKYTLANGLEVILHRDTSLPNVALNIWYHVGPANEPKGRSGFAHLFEHLMFEGSKYAGKDFDVLLESAGGTNMNGTTSFDRTNYYETVPSEYLELALWLESDRMGFMIDTLTEERLDVQRGVVLNERRQSYENRPYGPTELAMMDRLFPEGHPYHGNVIGSIQDLEHATMDDVRAFFAAYYAPSNATLTLAGDIDVPATKKLIEHYFGSLPQRPRPERPRYATPPLAASDRLELEEPVSLAKVTMAWITPPAFAPDEAAIELATHVLGSGKASRLYQDLVVTGLAASVDSGLDDNELGSVVLIEAMVSSGVAVKQVEDAIEKSLSRLADAGPTQTELTRAKKGIFLDLASSLQLLNSGGGEGGRAGVLQQLNHYLGDPGRLPAEMQHLGSVQGSEVRDAVRKYLPLEHRLTVVTQPKATPAEGADADGDAADGNGAQEAKP
jgi:zinc protease